MWKNFNFPTLLLLKTVISTYLIHPRLNLASLFSLNFGIIYLFEFFILVEPMKSDEAFTILSHVQIFYANKHKGNPKSLHNIIVNEESR